MSDIIDRAEAIINAAMTHPDPEGAMEALEAEAKGIDRYKFAGLWEALILALNKTPEAAES